MRTRRKPASAAMQIGEVAKRVSLSVDAIRYYEKRRLLPKPDRSAGRFRLYTPDAVKRLRCIRRMRALGFSLQSIEDFIQLGRHQVVSVSQPSKLKARLADVRKKIRLLRQLESELKANLCTCNHQLRNRDHVKCDQSGTGRIRPRARGSAELARNGS